jgi:hypothetical protein
MPAVPATIVGGDAPGDLTAGDDSRVRRTAYPVPVTAAEAGAGGAVV